MIASAAKPSPSASSPVDWFLDEIGRVLPPWVFSALFGAGSFEVPRSAPRASDLFGFGLRFVLDTSSLEQALRQQLKHGKSGLVDAMRSGFIRPIAPKKLDREIRSHHRRIAAELGVPLRAVRALYKELAAFIEFKPVRPAEVKRLKQAISNGEDAAFVALFQGAESLGVITEDKAFARIPGMRAYSGADACGVVLTFRKQATVFACFIPIAKAVWKLISGVFGFVATLVRQFPRLMAGLAIALVGFAVACPERAAKLLNALRGACSDLWALAEPHVERFATVAHNRILEANAAREKLEVGGRVVVRAV